MEGDDVVLDMGYSGSGGRFATTDMAAYAVVVEVPLRMRVDGLRFE